MRFLILDHYYPEFIAKVYRADDGLADAPFERQQTALDAGLFGETQFQAAALRALGHEALHLPVNVPSLLASFAREHGIRVPRQSAFSVRLRGGVIPWPTIEQPGADVGRLLPEIVDRHQPDVVHVQAMDVLDPRIVAGLKRAGVRVTGQTAAPRPTWDRLAPYDVVFSSLPNYVERFRREGVRAELLPLAFAPEVAERLTADTRDVAVSFVGSISPAHRGRGELLEALVRQGVPLDVWSSGAIPGARTHGPAWGTDMYKVLGRSRLTINVHGEHAAGNANNLRLYEGTGMGALLFTEAAPNLASLFKPDEEVVTYGDRHSLVSLIAHYLANPEEATTIANAGRARTLRDHTWSVRMGQMVAAIESIGPCRRPVARG